MNYWNECRTFLEKRDERSKFQLYKWEYFAESNLLEPLLYIFGILFQNLAVRSQSSLKKQ